MNAIQLQNRLQQTIGTNLKKYIMKNYNWTKIMLRIFIILFIFFGLKAANSVTSNYSETQGNLALSIYASVSFLVSFLLFKEILKEEKR